MTITKEEITLIIRIIKSIRQLKARLAVVDCKEIELIALKLHYFQSELMKHGADLVICIEEELNRGLSTELIKKLYSTEISMEKDTPSLKVRFARLKH